MASTDNRQVYDFSKEQGDLSKNIKKYRYFIKYISTTTALFMFKSGIRKAYHFY
jgi:hypothetical protein